MKKILFVLILTVFVLSACGTSATPVPVPTNTPVPLPTEIPVPTATIEPSPTPMPIGGGGKFIMQVNPLIVPKEFNLQKSASWFSASSDGTNLKLLGYQIWNISPDGKHALTYTSDNKVSLMNLDGTGELPLDDSLDYYIIPRSNVGNQTSLWLQNGDVVVLAREKENPAKFSVNIVSQDGKLKKLEKPSQIIKTYATFLFTSPDGKNLYWKNCAKDSCQFYVTALDDSKQEQILQNPTPQQDIHISPSGEYISYMVFPNCYLYKTADNTTKKLIPADGSFAADFCFGNNWSPTEDKLFGKTKNGYSILNVPDEKITTFSEITNVGSCSIANWMPDGKRVFLSVCAEANSKPHSAFGMGEAGEVYFYMYDFFPTIGARLINISDGKVTEYPDMGFCYAVVSPDSKWVLFDQCKNEKNLAIASQLLNLDTKVMIPVFQEFISDNPKAFAMSNDNIDRSWLVFWIP